MSGTAFEAELNNNKAFSNLNDNMQKALKEYFKNIYNVEDFKLNAESLDNKNISNELIEFAEKTGQLLSSNELQAVTGKAEEINNLIN